MKFPWQPELIFEKWNSKVEMVIDGGFGDNQPSTVIEVHGTEITVIREGKGSIDIF